MKKRIVEWLASTKIGNWIANFGLAIRKQQVDEIYADMFSDDVGAKTKPY